MKTMMVWALALAAVAMTVAPEAAEARSASRTLHVEVREKSGDQVSISVPVSLAKAALRIAGQVEIELEDDDVSVPEVRSAWNELRASGKSASIDERAGGERGAGARREAEGRPSAIDVKDGEDSVHITNKRGLVIVDVDGGDREKVKIALPETAIDALLSGDGNKLDLGAALDVLDDGHVGDLDVQDDEDHVRIWID